MCSVFFLFVIAFIRRQTNKYQLLANCAYTSNNIIMIGTAEIVNDDRRNKLTFIGDK